MCGVDDRCPGGVDPGGRAVPGAVAADEHFPVTLFDFPVMGCAKKCGVVAVGQSTVEPRKDVMDFAPGQRP